LRTVGGDQVISTFLLQATGDRHGCFPHVIRLFDLGVTPGPEVGTQLQYRIRMTPIGQCPQLFFDVGEIGQTAFTAPVVVPGGLGGEITDLRS